MQQLLLCARHTAPHCSVRCTLSLTAMCATRCPSLLCALHTAPHCSVRCTLSLTAMCTSRAEQALTWRGQGLSADAAWLRFMRTYTDACARRRAPLGLCLPASGGLVGVVRSGGMLSMLRPASEPERLWAATVAGSGSGTGTPRYAGGWVDGFHSLCYQVMVFSGWLLRLAAGLLLLESCNGRVEIGRVDMTHII